MAEGVLVGSGGAATDRRSRSPRWSRWLGTTVLPLVAFSLVGCGHKENEAASGQRDVATVTGSQNAADPKGATQAKLHEFGECMRAAGFDIPDPASLDAVKMPPEAHQGEGRTKASKCYQKLPPRELEKADPATMAEKLKYARCMRENGVPETQDPTDEGLVMESPPVNYNSKRFKKAYKACTGQEYESDGSGGPVG